ncbi:MAG: thiamine pyrophosphate-dependent dehydrogenase E1 component subunit alpha [Caldilineaceae bacterium SB0661_bin_32]|uniref:2-oxoisovalerate dehydrogenase subunit alpha n=1 Tax=Caldilineaceae bacterium SB0661_bin_32 TaxID=2605255 RepID=A0A6B1D2G1_9CHLR|nr:thiamine pyrophosphate-dependent dehydrogenase E1 component subunit alpha [Caldilineaceae bacterium SB0661_bin_32]
MAALTDEQKLEIFYWMVLARTFDEGMVSLWKQGRGLGGTFSQRGHEAVSVGSAYALAPEDIIAPMHRDIGAYFLRGLTPRRVFGNLLGKVSGVSGGRDANIHGMGDLSLGIVGYISHIPMSMPITLGVAMSLKLRNEARVAMTYVGDGGSNAGLWHETLNMAALYNAPYVLIVENNQYAYSTHVSDQMPIENIADRASGYDIPGTIVDGNDVEAVYRATCEAVERARQGGGPSLIEAKTMRMLGHAIHDGAEYVPRELLAEWEKKDPVARYQARLLAAEAADEEELDEIRRRAAVEIEDAIDFAEASPHPEPGSVEEGIYAP